MNKMFVSMEASVLNKIIFPLLLIVFLFVGFSAQAGKLHGGKLWWRDPGIRSQLNLTNEQVNKIEEIFQSYKKQIQVFHSELDTKKTELIEANKDPNTTRSELRKLHNEIFKIRSEGKDIKVNMFLDIREILNNNQRRELMRIKKDYYEKNHPKNTIFFQEIGCMIFPS